jgi:hypothetical protein
MLPLPSVFPSLVHPSRRLINKIKPGSVASINPSKMPFCQRENISGFLTGCRNLGLRETDLFMTVDLFENQNMSQVLQCLFGLGSVAQKIAGFRGPYYGVKLADANVREFSQEQLDAAKAAPSRQSQGSYGYADTTKNARVDNIIQSAAKPISSEPSRLNNGSLGFADTRPNARVDKILQLPSDNGTGARPAAAAASSSASFSGFGASAAPRPPPPAAAPPVAAAQPSWAASQASAGAPSAAGAAPLRKFCPECGAKLSTVGAKFCSECGSKL